MTKTQISIVSVFAVALFAVFAIAASVNAAAIAGDDVKCESFSAVYHIGEDGMRHAYPNEKIYFSHHADFGHIKTISCAALADIQLGTSVYYDAGKRLIKAPSVSIVYAVAPGGMLHPIKDEAQAIEVYGSDWAQKVDDIPEAFLTQYELGNTHPDSQLLEGTVLVGEDGKFLRADSSGFAIEIEDLVEEDEKEWLREYALEVSGVEERFERTLTKVAVASRTEAQTAEYEENYKVVKVEEDEKVDDVVIEEATEEEKEVDRAKKVEESSDDGTTSKDDDQDEDSSGTGTDESSEKSLDVTEDEEDSSSATPSSAIGLEVHFTQPAGSIVVEPGDGEVVLGQYVLGAAGADITVHDFNPTLLVQDVYSSGPFSVGVDGVAEIKPHLEDCKFKFNSSGNVVMGPLSGYQITTTQLPFTDDFYISDGEKVTLDLTCDMATVAPFGLSDYLAVYLASTSDIVATDMATGNAVTVTQFENNGISPDYYVELQGDVNEFVQTTYLPPSETMELEIGQCGVLASVTYQAVGDEVTINEHRYTLFDQDVWDYPFSDVSVYVNGALHENYTTSVPHIHGDNYIFDEEIVIGEGEAVLVEYAGCLREDLGLDADNGRIRVALNYNIFNVEDSNGDAVPMDSASQYGDWVEVIDPNAELAMTVNLNSGSPSGAAVPGYGEILRFDVTATGGDVYLVEIPFQITTTDNMSSNWNQCGDGNGDAMFADETLFELYDSTLTPVMDDINFYMGNKASCYSNGQYLPADLGHFIIAIDEIIAEGTTETFMLYVDTSGASAIGDDAIRIDITDEESFVWGDGIDKFDAVGVDYLPMTGTTSVY